LQQNSEKKLRKFVEEKESEVTKSIGKDLSEHLLALEFDALPDQVVEFGKVSLIDWLGAAFAGSHEDSVKILLRVLPTETLEKESTILPSGKKGSALFAAMINGVASHTTEMDDFHKTSMVHLGVTVIPAVLALAEKIQSTGKDYITSVVAGFEAGIRIGEAVNPSHWEFWHPTGTCGTLAAFAGCGHLLRLTSQQMAFGFGIAGTQAAGLRFYEGMNKHLHPGKAAMNGLLAALLAQQGFTGDERVFEGDTGFCKATAKDFNLDKITEKLPFLPQNFRSQENSYKPYPSCRHTHPAIDAVLKIVKANPFKTDELKSIECRTYSAATRLLNDPSVRDSVSAKFSIPFCIAIAVKDKFVGLDSFSPSSLLDPEVRSLMKRINVVVDPVIEQLYPDKWSAQIEVVTQDGRSFKEYVDTPKGDPENPMSRAEIIDKYKDLTKSIGEHTSHLILKKALNLETIKDIRELFDDSQDMEGAYAHN
jgi:2-methylcitrate dehydratase PrpD